MRFLTDDRIRAIIGVQMRTLVNRWSAPGGVTGRAFFWVLSAIWYVLVALGAWAVAGAIPQIKEVPTLIQALSVGLLVAFVYWQLIPVLLATTGVSLELKRLLVYPVPPSSLFTIEVLLRVTTGIEVLIMMTGAAAGLWRHAAVPFWAPFLLAPYALFNMLLSAGVRDLLTRLLARRGARELVVLGIVLLTALPQIFVTLFPPEAWRSGFGQLMARLPNIPWPWTVAARLTVGQPTAAAWAAFAGWLALAGWFGYVQFHRGLRWDADEQRARERATTPRRWNQWVERLYRLPSALLPDPLGVLVEKEFRFLSRAPRFRLVFFMGFSFGLMIWLPLLMSRGRQTGFFADNFLVWVSLYAAVLLGEVLFWNILGFDRTAAQAYYVMPVPLRTVLVAKNIASSCLLILEVAMVTAVVLILRVRVRWEKIPESFGVTLLLCLFLQAIGNLASVHFPRPVDPAQSWRHSSSGKVQGMLLLVYPVLAMPITIAYLARYAFDTDLAFYLVLASAYVVGGITYAVSLGVSVETAHTRREVILGALGRGEGPIG
jgi:ABC-2 type transport system permease protein